MRILYVALGFLPAVSWGGPVKVIEQQAKEMKRRGHEVTIAATNLLNKREYIKSGTFHKQVDGLNVYYLHTYNVPNWPGTLGPTWLSPTGRRKIDEIVYQADVVHINSTRSAVGIQAMREATKHYKPFVIQPHGTLPQIVNTVRLKRFFDNLYLYRYLRKADAAIALQQSEFEQIVLAGGKADKIHIVPNGLANESGQLQHLRGGFRLKWQIAPTEKVVLYLGRINRKKGVDLLVHAFAQLLTQEQAPLKLVIAGPDDGQLTEVKKLIEQYDIQGQVIIPGLLEGNDTWAALFDADLFVHPCRVDTFPMSLVEACQAGLPIVVTETCEIASLIAKAASVVPVEVEGISQAMYNLLNDDLLQAQKRQGGQMLMTELFSMGAIGDSLEKIYRDVISLKRQG
jgi:glycosyltransferase involved in cell wall biosynthesis